MPRHLIRKLEHFAPLSDEETAALVAATIAHTRWFEPRSTIVYEGDKPRAVNVFLEGWAARTKTLPDGRRQVVAYMLPGDICDFEVFLLHQTDHTLVAMTPVRLLELDREAFESLVGRFPGLRRALQWDALVVSAVQREWTLNLGQRTAYERMAHLFCEIYVRLRSVGLVRDGVCLMPVTQTDLGETLGLSVVHVNRTLQELRQDGLVSVQRRELEVLDFAGLAAAGLFTDDYLHLRTDPDIHLVSR